MNICIALVLFCTQLNIYNSLPAFDDGILLHSEQEMSKASKTPTFFNKIRGWQPKGGTRRPFPWHTDIIETATCSMAVVYNGMQLNCQLVLKHGC